MKFDLDRFIAWPSKASCAALSEAFGEAVLLKNESARNGARLAEVLSEEGPDQVVESANVSRFLIGVVMRAPGWVSENFWLSLVWAARLLKENDPLVFYGILLAVAIGCGAFLSRVVG